MIVAGGGHGGKKNNDAAQDGCLQHGHRDESAMCTGSFTNVRDGTKHNSHECRDDLQLCGNISCLTVTPL